MDSILLNTALLILAVVTLLLLFRPVVRTSRLWRATVTPLASIIGSGFLVVAPLLDTVVNGWAPLVILVIIVLAYAIGSVMRFNIRYLEPCLDNGEISKPLSFLTRLSDLALALAYVISVTFYLRLLASFLLRAVEADHDLIANIITTVILGFIGILGFIRGLHALEELEEYAVNVKLAIIAALLFGLVWFDIDWAISGKDHFHFAEIHGWEDTLRVLAGVLIIVQGFETSRYIGDEYDTGTRIRTMRYAQWLSGAIYLVFVSLSLPMLSGFNAEPDETAIIELSEKVAAILPAMLIIAAAMSQFSAAVADTVGAGGLLHEVSRKRIRPRRGYAMVTVFGIALVWMADIFEIIALASRAFAFYYLIQTLAAIAVSPRVEKHKWFNLTWHVLVAIVLALVVIFAIPAG